MKKSTFFTAAAVLLLMITSANAGLIDRGNGLIYDTDLDITWLQDANYSGLTFTWDEANTWAGDLVFQGFDDWRLPVSDTCSGNNCIGSEMGHLFYTEGITSASSGSFTNIKPSIYWSATENESNPLQASRFNYLYGTQGFSDKTTTRNAWAVRDGDVAPPVAPEPVSSLLFITGGTLLAARRYKGILRKIR